MSELQKFEIHKPESVLKLADELKHFISERRLSINLQGREFVKVEGWMYAGSQLGIIGVLIGLTNESTEAEIKYRADIELENVHTGKRVGRGIALCSNREPGKQKFQEYAIASMAQTRAIGKAYRLLLGWLIKAAGYESTPAEEMDAVYADVVEPIELPMSEKQANLIKELLENKYVPDDTVHKINRSISTSTYTVDRASKCIDYLKEIIHTNSQTT